jgi:hypothetical protein
MEQFYSLRKIVTLLTSSLLSYAAISQSVCGPVIQDFNNTGGSMAGFTSSTLFSSAPGFTYAQTGQDGYLQRCNVPSPGTVFTIVSPTYQSFASQTYVGYGFELSGQVQVSDLNVYVEFIGNDNNITPVQDLTPPAVVYSGSGNNAVAAVCDSFLLSQAAGFTPGESYRFVFELTAATASNNNQCIVFDNFRTTGGPSAAPLPVSFIGFGVKKSGSGIELIWNVAGESGVQAYVVERSTDGRSFIKLGEVAATNSTAYSFVDNQPQNGMAYYRIKELDMDGKFRYSTIVRLNLERNISLKVYPSPARGLVTIEHPVTNKGSLRITTTDGRVVKQIDVKPELNQTVINISNLKAGLYIIRFINGTGPTENVKLIKE